MAIRQPTRQVDDEAADYWAEVIGRDIRLYGTDRTIVERAASWGIERRTLHSYVKPMKLPPKPEIGIRIGQAVGMTEEEVLSFYRRLWSRRSTNQATAR